MWKAQFEGYRIILGSGSPRRQQFLKDLELDFEIRIKEVDEVYPENLQGAEISDFLAKLKASVFKDSLLENDILITSDTVVWHKGAALGKPKNESDAIAMLKSLSNDWHEVITSVCFTLGKTQVIINHTTAVKFKALTNSEIVFYVEQYKPLDKAGAYGIQEWIGLIGIEEIRGSYANVVGLPTHLVYKTLMTMVS